MRGRSGQPGGRACERAGEEAGPAAGPVGRPIDEPACRRAGLRSHQWIKAQRSKLRSLPAETPVGTSESFC